MKRLTIWLLLAFPSLIWASGITIQRSQNFQQPPGWIDRVSKRGMNYKILEKDSIGSGRFLAVISPSPMHYDSAGTWKNIVLEEAPDTSTGYNYSLRTARWSIDINTLTGAFRFLRDKNSEKASIRFTPGFSPASVGFDYNVQDDGVKATYTLPSGNRLAWAYTCTATLDTSESHGKGKGRLKNTGAKIKAEVSDFSARDARGKVVPLTVMWDDDSLIVTLDTSGALYPIRVDPSVKDSTALYTTNSKYYISDNSSFATARDTTQMATDNWIGFYCSGNLQGATYEIIRSAGVFPLADISGYSIDSGYVVGTGSGSYPTDTIRTVFVMGNYTGVPQATDYDSFYGKHSGSAHTPIELTERTLRSNGDGTTKYYLTQTGKDSVLAALGDTLRTMLIEVNYDLANKAPTVSDGNIKVYLNTANYLYLFVDTLAVPPTASVLTDSVKPAVDLVLNMDATGNAAPATSATYKLWLKGSSVTTVVTISGSFGLGPIALHKDSLALDTAYYWYGGVTSAAGTGWSGVGAFSTYINSSVTNVRVDGRLVNRAR